MAPSAQPTAPALPELLRDQALAGEWVHDSPRSSVRLKSRTVWGLVPVNGEVRQVSGSSTVSAAGDVSGAITVGAASIDTKNTRRDTQRRSADFFDSDPYPEITFTVDSVQPSGQGVTVAGTLTGGQPVSWVSLTGELLRDWARQEAPAIVEIVVTGRLLKEQ